MKHLKTFESYQSVNEGVIGNFLRNAYSKAKNAFRGWKDRRQKRAAMKIAEFLEENKDDPKLQKLLLRIKSEYDKLPQSDKDQLERVLRQGELEDGIVRESKFLSHVGASLSLLGLSTAGIGFMTFISAVPLYREGDRYYTDDAGIVHDLAHLTEKEIDNLLMPDEFLMGLPFPEFCVMVGIVILGIGVISSLLGGLKPSDEDFN